MSPTSRPATPLPVIEVPDPCPADWRAMAGDDRARFCAHCRRHVHGLSAMRSEEVADLVCRTGGRLCVRFQVAADGRVKTLDYAPPPARWRVSRRWVVFGIIAAMAAGAGRMFRPREEPRIVAGVMMPVPVVPPAVPPVTPAYAPAPPTNVPPPTVCP